MLERSYLLLPRAAFEEGRRALAELDRLSVELGQREKELNKLKGETEIRYRDANYFWGQKVGMEEVAVASETLRELETRVRELGEARKVQADAIARDYVAVDPAPRLKLGV